MGTSSNKVIEQFLTFNLDGEVYAIGITRIREVLDLCKITRIPKMPEFVRGMINLRGGVVPIIDLRSKLGIPRGEETVNTCIIIIELILESESTLLGAVADSVREVISIESNHIDTPPQMGNRISTEFIRGMSKYEETFLIILDVDKVFSVEELSASFHNTTTQVTENNEVSEENNSVLSGEEEDE